MTSLDAILRASPDYVDSLYRQYLEDPDSVDVSWALFFAGYQVGGNGLRDSAVAHERDSREPVVLTAQGALPEGARETIAHAELRIYDLVFTYRTYGHLIAELDPLGQAKREHPLLDLSEFGYTDEDLDQNVHCTTYRGLQEGTLGQFLESLRKTYCGSIGVEYMHITDKQERDWLQDRMEPIGNTPIFESEQQREILRQLVAADVFEETIHRRFPGAKRFSLEGGTTLIPLLRTIVDEAADLGTDEIVMGMAHRGRLNVLAHVMGKPYTHILAEFEGRPLPPEIQGYGDVKYHLGYSRDYNAPSGRKIHLLMAFNPSHLESVDPVVEGIVRGKQSYFDDQRRERALPLLLHGDAAFAAQGIVSETFMLSGVTAYETGGTVHVIINNQIGFTTDPTEGRSTRYASDIAEIVHAPVFHVNGDDAQAVVHVARLAAEYRQTFHRDVIIDLICYRRYGHNELDDPTFTQPRMYAQIDGHRPNSQVYADDLVAAGVVSDGDVEKMRADVHSELDRAHEEAQRLPEQPMEKLGGVWEGLTAVPEDWRADTAVPREELERVARALVTAPEEFQWHRRLKRMMEQRAATVLEGGDIDWGGGEALAIGSLLLEGTNVRLTGQDSGRGTFSHRHGVYSDQNTGEKYTPLDHIAPDRGRFELVNSPLSELAALGFEYGFSLADPWTLVIWEAQFGDFVNNAQVVIDQFIASGEYKWRRMSGLVLLLPHGYEGQGPEHSSARLERFLELCAEANMQVCNLTTPAQLFHALRRQMKRDFRKPLIVMSPKSLLRHKLAVSRLQDFTDGRFQAVIDDPEVVNRDSVRQVILCSGKIYYTLLEARKERLVQDTALVRVEQLYPFPNRDLGSTLQSYPNVGQLSWLQEEPANMGAWRNTRHWLEGHVPDGAELRYVGREPAASPATGSYRRHQEEEAAIVDRAFEQ